MSAARKPSGPQASQAFSAKAAKPPKPPKPPKSPKVSEPDSPLEAARRYAQDSRDLFTSMVLVLPLFILYQVGVLVAGGVRNGVDFMTDLMWWAARGELGYYLAIQGVLLLGFILGILALRHRGTFRPKIWPWVVAESTLYAIFLGSAVLKLMTALGLGALLSTDGAQASGGVVQAVVLSLGAGLYEETVFRLVGMGGLFLALRRLGRWPDWASAALAVLASSLLFSAIHHVGALGDPFTLGVFGFRFFAGVLLALIFYLRGFAVAVYTHAIYDIIVMVARA